MSNAWFDYPSTDNKAHSAAECSNRGGCDRETGECACQEGFTGAACQFTECPGKEVMPAPGRRGMPGRQSGGSNGNSHGGARECSGHGRCVDMGQFAKLAASDRGDLAGFTCVFFYFSCLSTTCVLSF